MTRTRSLLSLALALTASCAVTPAFAQVTPSTRDSSVAKATRAAVDTVRRTYPSTLKTAKTLKRMMDRVDSAASALVYVAPVPPPPVVTPPQPVVIPPAGTIDTTLAPSIAARAIAPRATPTFTFPTAARTVRVPAPGRMRSVLSTVTFGLVDAADLQGALDDAQAGDSIVLPAGATYVGHFALPSCRGGWVTLTSAGTLPPAGTRVTPTTAAAYAKIVATDYGPTIRTAAAACRYRLVGVEIVGALESSSIMSYGIVKLGGGGDEGQTALASVPTDIVLDRVYVHGTALHNDTRCIVLNSANTQIVNSWISDCHAKGSDSQAIEGWNGPGPYLLENNVLAGAGENVMFGGGDPGITGLSPSDITIRRNHVYKDPAWKGVWTVKNLFELKNARRVLVEQNVFENNWADAQVGMAIVLKSSGDANAANARWQGTTDVTFRWNIVRNSPVGFNALAVDCAGQACVDVKLQRVTVEQNLFSSIGPGAYGSAHMLLSRELADVRIAHNTFVHAPGVLGLAMMLADAAGTATRLDISDNVFTAGRDDYAVHFSTSGSSALHGAGLTAFAGSSYAFQRNVVSGISGSFVGQYPSTSWYPSTAAAIGFAADYALGPASQFRGKGYNGTDPGADIAELTRRTAGVVVAP